MTAVLRRRMGRTKKPESEDSGPSSETVRVAVDLMELLREICFHDRDSRNRRPKITQVVDELLRGPAVKRHAEVMKRAKKQDSE